MDRRAPLLSTKVFYGLGSVAYGVKDNGFAFFLLLYYNQVLGLDERLVGLAIMLALVADALSDPIVGYASDHLHSRWGRRHPFMYASAVPVAISYYLLWSPPAGLSGQALFFYLIVLAILVRTFITLYEIPSSALVAELTDDYDQRTSMLSFRYFFGWWGGLTMAALAYSVFLQPDASSPVGVLNAAGYRRYGLAAALIMVAAILASALGTHRHIPYLRKPASSLRPSLRSSGRELRETLSNRSFQVLFIAGFFSAMATGLTSALNIYFNTYFWELDSDQIFRLVLCYYASATLAFLVTPKLSQRFGKKRSAVMVSMAAILIGPLPILLRLAEIFPANHDPALLPTLMAYTTIEIALIIISSILVSSMVADTVEESELTTGRRSEGVFFAARSFIGKAVSGFGVMTSTLLLGAIDFPRDAQPGGVDPQVVARLGKVYVPLLVTLYLASLAFLGAYRISRASHEENLARLERRSAGET